MLRASKVRVLPTCGARTLSRGADARWVQSGAVCAVANLDTAALLAEKKTARPMNLVFVSAEVAPWSKTGGLGDVVGSLPVELAKRGHKVMTISPR